MRVLLIVLAAAAALAGCTSGNSEVPAPSASVITATRPPLPTGTSVPQVSDVAAVFIAALGGGSGPGSISAAPRVYIHDATVCSQLLHKSPCPPTPIPPDVRAQVIAALGSRVIFTASPPTRLSPDTSIAVTFGAPKIVVDRATVTVETNCGPLCGLGETVVLERHVNRWVRVGATGPSWIS